VTRRLFPDSEHALYSLMNAGPCVIFTAARYAVEGSIPSARATHASQKLRDRAARNIVTCSLAVISNPFETDTRATRTRAPPSATRHPRSVSDTSSRTRCRASWSATAVALQPGTNVLTVTARDVAANTATDTLTVISDSILPTVAITSPTSASTYSTGASILTLSGTASDNVGVVKVTWTNSAGGSGTATGTTIWTASDIILQPGTNVLTVVARDAVGNGPTDKVTVTFDNLAGTVEFGAPTFSITERRGPGTVVVERTGTAGTVTVDYATFAGGTATAGADYMARSGRLTFGPGVTTQTISIPIIDDNADEGDETIAVRLTNAIGAVLGPSAPRR
jgi:hypothetical protein